MSFLGISYLEIFTVLLVALVFLGPDKMIETAKRIGKTLKDVRKIASEFPSLEDIQQPETLRTETTNPELQTKTNGDSPSDIDSNENLSESDGPVAFRKTEEQSQLLENTEENSSDESNLDR